MKTYILAPIFGFILLSSCSSETAVSPDIKVASCSVNDTVVSGVPSVKAGDVVELALKLEGNGSELVSFQANADEEEVKMSLADYEKKNVSNDKNFTNTTECQLRFVDGVTISSVKVKATVNSVQNEGATLKFYLSAKAEGNGSELEVNLKKK
ncbi:DUF5035 family protein [uncultured Bacteroides sp.]|uniref:DUF5035 family protein n=1 Tax=uncultured Bacteroides sp. TaxID=162156 RepID=UPI002AABB5E0|nr:DUF5035 family protein [uncultured Bacteroides sp.]